MSGIEWSVPALQDLKAAGDYIASDNPSAANRMASRVRESVEYLQDYPNIGRAGRLSGTKELVVAGTPFIVSNPASSSSRAMPAMMMPLAVGE